MIEHPQLARRRVSRDTAGQIIDLQKRVAELEASQVEVIEAVNALNAAPAKAKKGTANAKSSSPDT